ncbi:MAG: DUF3224 domain-containing protein [Actinobacteria bacterium]|nr:DUF3224 domain-containing protein [Actinomycetota bacterium]
MTTATASFEITSWEPARTDERPVGPAIGKVTVRKTFTGDLEGSSVAELLTVQKGDEVSLTRRSSASKAPCTSAPARSCSYTELPTRPRRPAAPSCRGRARANCRACAGRCGWNMTNRAPASPSTTSSADHGRGSDRGSFRLRAVQVLCDARACPEVEVARASRRGKGSAWTSTRTSHSSARCSRRWSEATCSGWRSTPPTTSCGTRAGTVAPQVSAAARTRCGN